MTIPSRLPDVLLALAEVADVPAETGWLAPSERDRLLRIGHGSRRAQFLAGHVLARQLAAAFAGGEPSDWRFQVVADQRRELVHVEGRRLCLSLSHSQSQLAAAVADRPVGLDLEAGADARDWRMLAGRLFAPATAARILDARPADQAARFQEAWSLHEARAKQGGEGLQRSRLKRLDLLPAEPGQADALAWRLSQGCLALAGWPGMQPGFASFASGAPGAASGWAYVDAGPA